MTWLGRNGASLAAVIVPALLASACGSLPAPPDPRRVTAEVQPRTPVVRNITSSSAGASIPWLSLGVSRDQLVSVVSMDLNIGDVVSRPIVPGLSSTNSIAVVKTGEGQDTEGLIDKAGIFFEVSGDRSQGSHQSVRTLVELGLIEVLGKLTQVPYWRCLQIDSTNPQMIAEARDWFDRMDRTQRTHLVQDSLHRYGVFHGEVDGTGSREFENAVSRYQDENDLIADGRIDFDLCYSLLANDLAIRNDGSEVPERTP